VAYTVNVDALAAPANAIEAIPITANVCNALVFIVSFFIIENKVILQIVGLGIPKIITDQIHFGHYTAIL